MRVRGRRSTHARGRGADRAGRAAAHVPVVPGAHPHALRAVVLDQPAVLLAGRRAHPHHHAECGAAPGCRALCPPHPALALPLPATASGAHALWARCGRSRLSGPGWLIQAALVERPSSLPALCMHALQQVLCWHYELAHAKPADHRTLTLRQSRWPSCSFPPG